MLLYLTGLSGHCINPHSIYTEMIFINNRIRNAENKSLITKLVDIEKYDNTLFKIMPLNMGDKETKIINKNETMSFQV